MISMPRANTEWYLYGKALLFGHKSWFYLLLLAKKSTFVPHRQHSNESQIKSHLHVRLKSAILRSDAITNLNFDGGRNKVQSGNTLLFKDVGFKVIYNNDFTLIIDTCFSETFSTPNFWKSTCALIFRHPVWC